MSIPSKSMKPLTELQIRVLKALAEERVSFSIPEVIALKCDCYKSAANLSASALIRRGLVERAEGRPWHDPIYRITAAGIAALEAKP